MRISALIMLVAASVTLAGCFEGPKGDKGEKGEVGAVAPPVQPARSGPLALQGRQVPLVR